MIVCDYNYYCYHFFLFVVFVVLFSDFIKIRSHDGEGITHSWTFHIVTRKVFKYVLQLRKINCFNRKHILVEEEVRVGCMQSWCYNDDMGGGYFSVA